MSGIKAVVLAAGAARRFGGSKLTASFNGQPLIAGALRCALAAPVDTVALVTGGHAEAVERAATALQAEAVETGRLKLVRCADAMEGMSASLRAGLFALGEAEGVFVFLGDMPAIPLGTLTEMVHSLRQSGGVDAVAPVWEGRRGHPVLFGRALLPALAAVEGDEGGRAILARFGERLSLTPAADGGVLLDFDTPDDFNPVR